MSAQYSFIIGFVFFLKLISCSSAFAEPLRYPTLQSYVEELMGSEARVPLHQNFFYIDNITSFLPDGCPSASEVGNVLYGLRMSAAMNQLADYMAVTSFYFDIWENNADPDFVREILPGVSDEVASSWRNFHRSRDRLASATSCIEEFEAIENYVEAFDGLRVDLYHHEIRLYVYDSIADGVYGRENRYSDMRRWRADTFSLIPKEDIFEYAMVVYDGADAVDAELALGDGSKNRLLLVAHPEASARFVNRVIAALSEIEGPFAVREAENPEEFGIEAGEMKVFAFNQEVDGILTIEKIDRLISLFENVSTLWQQSYRN